jgi:hypothetical protein
VKREKQLLSNLSPQDYYGAEPALSNPKFRKLQNIQRKQNISELALVKEEKKLIQQRDRLMDSAWRNGVTGVKVLPNEDP